MHLGSTTFWRLCSRISLVRTHPFFNHRKHSPSCFQVNLFNVDPQLTTYLTAPIRFHTFPSAVSSRHFSSIVNPGPGQNNASFAAESSPVEQNDVVYYPGARAPFTSRYPIEHVHTVPIMPCFRIMNEKGDIIEGALDFGKHLGTKMVKELYKKMVSLNVMDHLLYNAQRQGRISFYMTSSGEEGTVIGTAAALHPHDEVYGQYREQGVLLWRGFTYSQFVHQCCGSALGHGRGRQMPVHYGSRTLFFHTVSSPLATQMPHAVGTGYLLKRRNAQIPEEEEDKHRIAAVFFGDGAASEGDFHVALNFAATTESQTLFLCRNNGYAISTPTAEQYRGDGIVRRALGYGIDSVRVDGNDVYAVIHSVRKAREYIVKQKKPFLIEFMTYRGGHHSTSDDSSRYRDGQEIKLYMERANPITRLKEYMKKNAFWEPHFEEEFPKEQHSLILKALEEAEKHPPPSPEDMFTQVYYEKPRSLQIQEQEFLDDLEASRNLKNS